MTNHQQITQATCDSIISLTCDLPPRLQPLAKVATDHCKPEHMPDNIRTGLNALFNFLFSGRSLQADPVHDALGTLIDIGDVENEPPEATQAKAVLKAHGAIGDALAAAHWLRAVQALAAADGVAVPLH